MYLIGPGFLFGEPKEVNTDSLMVMGAIEYNPNVFENIKKFLMHIKNNYRFRLSKKYYYNFSTLGQLVN